jgi:membrane-associated phospholipid phosphatase
MKRHNHIIITLFLIFALVFASFPELDIAISTPFYKTDWRFTLSPMAKLIRDLGHLTPTLIGIISLYSIIISFTPLKIWHIARDKAVFLLSTLLISPILIVNVILKDHWHRARPVQIKQFGGDFTFTPWYQFGNPLECVKNCSFVSGEGAGAFWLLALAFLTPPPYRRLSFILITIFAILISFLRLSFGGHFISDLVFASIISYSVVTFGYYILQRQQK